MVELGFSLQAKYDCPQTQMIEQLCDVGFSAVSPIWSPDLPLASLAECVRKHNMTIQSLHAPYKGISQLWNPQNPVAATIQKNMMDCIDSCARFRIPIAVVHSWQGLGYVFPKEPLDFSIFDRIVDYAAQRKVSLAFENLEGEEYLEALMVRYRGCPQVGFCWDSGHDHCYTHKLDFLKEFGQQLIMTHLNDNKGARDPSGMHNANDDLHFLPYDGNIRWKQTLEKLASLPRQKILDFEFKKRSHSTAAEDLIYDNLSLTEFLCLAGQRARSIAGIYEQIMERKL